MTLSLSDLHKIAHLARLKLTAEEEAAFQDKLSSILEMVAAIQAVDTSGVEPMAHPFSGLTQPLRPDEVTEPDVREVMQKLAPQAEAGLYLVPKVIEG